MTIFNVTSLGEFAAVHEVSQDAEMIHMHSVKEQSHIPLALEICGIRVIAVNHEDDINKLTRVVRALDLN